MEHYRRLRLEKARSLIANSPLSLTEIAVATGFAGLSHFSRAFREAYGHAPSRLRGQRRGSTRSEEEAARLAPGPGPAVSGSSARG